MVGDGWEVTGFDLIEGNDGGVRYLVGDLRDPEAVEAAVSGYDVVCHIGAIGDVYLAGEQPALASSVNVTGSAHVAAAAGAAGARVVYASTWEVYGPPQYQPVDEDHPCDPDHPYSITKLAGERMMLAADHSAGVPVIALRLGTAFGSYMRPNSVFRLFIDRARRGEPITIQGDGSQGRQFTHAADIAHAFSLASASDAHGVALNIVAPETVSIKELAEMVVDRFPTEVTFGDARPGDVAPALVSSDRARAVLGWKATVPFEEGLNELMDSVDEG
jgi:UDP-glucose 4-epimerase